jgi:hypothetical protein
VTTFERWKRLPKPGRDELKRLHRIVRVLRLEKKMSVEELSAKSICGRFKSAFVRGR